MNKEEIILKLITMLVGENNPPVSSFTTSSPNPLLGKYVLVRCYDAGVRAGKLIDATPGNIILEDARMLWYRWCRKGVGLSGIASYGIDDTKKDVKILATQKKIVITDSRVSTFFECATEVEKQIREYPSS